MHLVKNYRSLYIVTQLQLLNSALYVIDSFNTKKVMVVNYVLYVHVDMNFIFNVQSCMYFNPDSLDYIYSLQQVD